MGSDDENCVDFQEQRQIHDGTLIKPSISDPLYVPKIRFNTMVLMWIQFNVQFLNLLQNRCSGSIVQLVYAIICRLDSLIMIFSASHISKKIYTNSAKVL